MKRYFHILLALVALMTVCPQQMKAEYGDWRVYASYHNASKVAVMGERVYVLSDGSLFSYDPEDTSVETYDKATALSDHGIFDIAHCEATKELLIVYSNGNVDLMNAQGECYNMSELKSKTLNDKTINELSIVGTTAYVSTNSGIVVVDVAKRVFANFYDLGHNVLSTCEHNGTIYAATKDGVYAGGVSSNLLDRTNWTKLSGSAIQHIVPFADSFYALTSSGLHKVTDMSKFSLTRLSADKFTSYSASADKLYFFHNSKTVSVDKSGTLQNYTIEGAKPAHMVQKGSTYWAAMGEGGLKGLKLNSADFEETVPSVIPSSPKRNYTYKLNMVGNRLLVAGGAFNYSGGNSFMEGTIMKYEDGEWTAFDEAGPKEVSGNRYFNITDIVQDPLDPEHHFAGAVSSGLYEFQGGKLQNYYTHFNSPITSILPEIAEANRYTRITALAFDNDRNLWMCNNECDTIVRVRKSDGKWTAFHFDEIAGYPTFDYTVFDSRGWVWMNSRRSTPMGHQAGVFVLNTNGTLDKKTDDKHKFVGSFKNQDGKSYAPDLMNCIALDLSGAMWFGTSVGLFVSYNPAEVFNSNFYLSQVKVPRNDGTNLADYLLNGVQVKCITIDGGNRKWIGTSGNGLYLISSDGLETIEHFTVDNSPLISNNIFSVAIDGQTGEVFIATDCGLVSFMGNATDPAEEFDSDLVKVYPNPVRPDYQGQISITGLMYNSNVKIVNAAGRLVNEGTSVGGEYTWNGLLSSGKRAASGVYYVFATDEMGDEGVAAKFLIVR